ncbi:hypothetical protein KW850_16010 [Bacillus sp. sid0103]|uniref:hypothetical protein n=1 Tax=Bacillus sp. sid0103 TaxID=2856337 RepID=UPI001C47A1E3|nr:hypothetical protein [Bacillus sp. sid0103]MBV7506770.1 hypothetical protein [Bacillus sp. sid0103]
MDKKLFKDKVINLLEQEVIGLSSENKLKYMKKCIREYELTHSRFSEGVTAEVPVKVGVLVRTTIKKIVRSNLLSAEKITLLQDARYCKATFDINYPFLKKVEWGRLPSEQRKINGYDRYWADEIIINRERYFICNDWYERNKLKSIKWVKELQQ